MNLSGYLLLALAEVVDVYGYSDQLRRNIYRLGKGLPGYNYNSTKSVVRRMLMAGDIERVVNKSGQSFKVTSKGFSKIKEIIPITRLSEKWDGKFRMVIYDIEEVSRNNRDSVRIKLKSLGFAMLQKSIWITPFNIEAPLLEYLSGVTVGGEILTLRSTVLTGDIQSIARRVWGLNELEEKYRSLIEVVDSGVIISTEEAQKWELQYFDILASDPLLPKELLPEDWVGFKVRSLYKKLIIPLLNK